MHRTWLAGMGLVVLAAAISLGLPEIHAAGGFANKTVTRIGVVVHDAGKSAAAFADAFGVKGGPVREVKPAGFPSGYQGDAQAFTRVADLYFDNVVLQVVQPMGGRSPWRDFLDAGGEGLHHIALAVPDVETQAQRLEAVGGKRLVGAAGDNEALIDLWDQLGTNIVLTPLTGAAPTPAPGPAGGGQRIARLGAFVPVTDKARAAYNEVFGITLPQPVDERGMLKFPAGFTGDTTAGMRHVFVPLDNLWINVIQPLGGQSPWRDILERRNGYLLLSVSDVEGSAKALEARGGRRTLGDGGGVYAYIDMDTTLGLTVLYLRSGLLPK